MSYTLDNYYSLLPASGNAAYLAGKGQAQDSYRAWRMARNINYLVAARSPQVLASGNNCTTDYGAHANAITNSWFTVTSTGDYYLRHRARVLVWPPRDSVDIKMVFRASRTTLGAVKLWVIDQPLPTDLQDTIPPSAKTGEKTGIGTDFTTAHSISVADCPVSPDGWIYLYVGLKGITKFGSWCIYREAYDG